MKRTVLVFLTMMVLTALASTQAAAQAITVTPADATIAVGQRLQFVAAGSIAAAIIDAGSFHTCAVVQDGTVRCWGLNDSGQLGDGSMTSSSVPVVVPGVASVVGISGGGYHTCARIADGTLSCWGRNDSGQLGDPATARDASTTPVRVTGITTAAAVTAGGFHTCALLQDGTVQCWGRNESGQLGNGTAILDSDTPVTVSGLTGVVTVSAGGWHACSLRQDGTVWCWGKNDDGQLGNGTILPSPVPVAASGITTAVAVEAGIFHTCALLQDGAVRCWGRNGDGQLGNGATANSAVPTTVSGITPAALAPGAEHTCALLADGTVRCWGDNNFGQLGNGSGIGVATSPAAPVTGISGATSVTSGAVHSCALLPEGTVQCWGQNFDGRLGDGTTNDARTPVTVAMTGVTWASSDPSIATITATGVVTGQSPGTTAITATSGSRTGSTTLTVVSRPTLSVIREGAGSGSVTSSPAGIDCGATCSASYDLNTAVTLTATPVPGSTFEGWTGGGCSGTGRCTVTMTGDSTVFARFGVLLLMPGSLR